MFEPLSKIYYKYPNDYKQIFDNRYNSDVSTKLDFPFLSKYTFFAETKKINKLIYETQNWNVKIIKLMNILPKIAIEQFKMKCLIDEIIQTNDIEGVRSTRKEVKDVIEKPENKNKRFYGIVQKYLKLADSELDIKNVHDIRKLFDDIVSLEIQNDDPKNKLDGKIFRKESVSVYTANQREIHKGVYPETSIINAFKKSISILNDININPLIRISIFHYLFGFIHPFYDGNGRVSRFISSYYFSKELNSLVGYRLSYTIKEHLKEYYDAFEVCNNKKNMGELTYFIETFLSILEKSMSNLYDALEERKNKLHHYFDILKNIESLSEKDKNVCKLLIQAELFSDNGISTNELVFYLNITKPTLTKRLESLNKSNLVKIDKSNLIHYYGIDLEKFAKLE